MSNKFVNKRFGRILGLLLMVVFVTIMLRKSHIEVETDNPREVIDPKLELHYDHDDRAHSDPIEIVGEYQPDSESESEPVSKESDDDESYTEKAHEATQKDEIDQQERKDRPIQTDDEHIPSSHIQPDSDDQINQDSIESKSETMGQDEKFSKDNTKGDEQENSESKEHKEDNGTPESSLESTNKLSNTYKSQKKVSRLVSSAVLQRAIDYITKEYDPSSKLIPKVIHQQYSTVQALPQHYKVNMGKFQSKNPDYVHLFWADVDLDEFVKLYHPYLYGVYKNLPKPILRADLARYMLLHTFGGVYSDLDTIPLRPMSDWDDGNNVGLIVGVEVDTNRKDWKDWYPRSFGLCQWTIAAEPGHPILSSTIYRSVKKLRESKDVADENVVEVTGPGIWTDVVLEYLSLYNVQVEQLRDMEKGQVFGDVYVLPITAFSPNVGHMGSKDINDKEARVHHLFEGGWKKAK